MTVALKFTTADADRLLGLADQLLSDWADAAVQAGKPDRDYEERNAEWDAIRPLLVQAPALLELLDEALRAMSAMRTQINQMRGMFPDEDGTIQAACDDHDRAQWAASKLLVKIRPVAKIEAPTPGGPT